MALTPTSLKMPAALKQRVDAAAKAAGKTPHAFMLAAIEEETTRALKYAEFIAEALHEDREFERDGKYYDFEEAFQYLRAKAAGKRPRRPRLRTWRR